MRIDDPATSKSPQGELGKACDYSLRHWKYLATYLEHGRVEIDNNLKENAIRLTGIVKKNWLFVGHPEAGEPAAILYSILISCQRLEIDPATSLSHILGKDHPNMGDAQLTELTPASWKNRPHPRCLVLLTMNFTTKNFDSVVDDGRLYFWFADDAQPGEKYFLDQVYLINLTSNSVPTPTGLMVR